MPDKKRSGLGRGIDAIFSDFEGEEISSEEVTDLNINDIRPNPYQPRKKFNEKSLEGLAQSIKENGVLQPIIVRKSVNGFEIIAGERRTRASKMAGKKTIPAIVRNLNESQMMEAGVLENLQREDLSPIEEAQAYKTLLDKLHLTQEQVSKKLGKSRSYIANSLRLLSLPNKVKKYVSNGQLDMAKARALLGLKDPEQIEELSQKAVDEGLTVRQLDELINKPEAKKPRKRSYSKSPFIRETEEELIDKFGTNVKVTDTKGGKGKIQIDFASTKDLNRILELLHIIKD